MATASSSLAADRPGPPGVLTQAWAVLVKDLRVEFRTRLALAAVVLFALTTLVAVGFAVGPGSSASVQAALLWIVLYFAALTGLTRAFVGEEEARTADGLRLAAGGSAVFVGKLAFNLLLLAVLALLLVPGFVLLMGTRVADVGLLVGALVAGGAALGSALTFTGALVAQAHSRGTLGAVVSFPLVAPLLKLAMDATQAAFLGGAGSGGWAAVTSAAALGGIVTVLAVLLFDTVWSA